MAFPSKLSQLCSPAWVYFVLSTILILIAVFQNLGNTNYYRLGSMSCGVPSTFVVFAIKIVYILFWTWILNLICRDGHSGIAWLLVLFPFVLLFVILALVMASQRQSKPKKQEGRGMAIGNMMM